MEICTLGKIFIFSQPGFVAYIYIQHRSEKLEKLCNNKMVLLKMLHGDIQN